MATKFIYPFSISMIITYPFIHQLFTYINVTHHISNRTIIYPSFFVIHQSTLTHPSHTSMTHSCHLPLNHTSIILLSYINVQCCFKSHYHISIFFCHTSIHSHTSISHINDPLTSITHINFLLMFTLHL